MLGYCKCLITSLFQSKKVNNVFFTHEILSGFFTEMSQSVQGIECSQDGVVNFIRFCQTVTNFSLSPVSSFHLIYPNFTSCRISFDLSDINKFEFIYFTDYNSTHLQIYKYDEEADFQNWDPTTPSHFARYLEKSFFNFINDNDGQDEIVSEVIFEGADQWSKQLAIYRVNRQNGEILNINSVCVDIQNIYDLLGSVNTLVESRFALIRGKESDVIFTSDLGIMMPILYYGNTKKSIFPNFNQLNSTFWSIVSIALNGIYDTPVLIDTSDKKWSEIERDKNWTDEIDGRQYVAVKTKVSSLDVAGFEIVTVISLSEMVSDYFFLTSLVFILLWVVLGVLFVLTRLISKYEIRNSPSSDHKSALIDAIGKDVDGADCNNTSTIWRAVNRIRNYEIAVPDDLDLNKTLDEVVTELTQNNERLFSIALTKDCTFCSELAKNRNSAAFKNSSSCLSLDQFSDSDDEDDQKAKKGEKNKVDEQTYEIWKILSKPFSFEIVKMPNWKLIKKDPVKSLVMAYISVIQKFNLVIPEFDPDLMIQFMIEFSSKSVTNHFYTIFLFHYSFVLLTAHFNKWLLQKIDIFILFFVGFVKDINMDRIVKILKNNKNNEDSLLQDKYLIFDDKYSKSERKLEYIWSVFYKYFPPHENSYFEENVRDILFGVEQYNQIELFCLFQNRIQSPDFNVHNDIFDRRLFIKALLCLCSQWPYFTSEELMLKSLKSLTPEVFNNLNDFEEPDFIPSYHSSFVEMFVKPWIQLFNQFSPMTEFLDNVNNTLSYWNKVRETAHNIDVEY